MHHGLLMAVIRDSQGVVVLGIRVTASSQPASVTRVTRTFLRERINTILTTVATPQTGSVILATHIAIITPMYIYVYAPSRVLGQASRRKINRRIRIGGGGGSRCSGGAREKKKTPPKPRYEINCPTFTDSAILGINVL